MDDDGGGRLIQLITNSLNEKKKCIFGGLYY